MIDAVHQTPVVQFPVRVAFDHLAFEFELHHRRGFLHTRDDFAGPHPLPLRLEELRRIVGIDRTGEVLQRRQWHAISFVQLAKTSVA